MRAVGEWLRPHGRAVYGCGASEYAAPPDCRCTQRGDRLYLHLFAWPFGHVHLPGLAGRVRYAQLLHDGSEIPTRVIDPARRASTTIMPAVGERTLTLDLPTHRPDVEVPVVELFLTD